MRSSWLLPLGFSLLNTGLAAPAMGIKGPRGIGPDEKVIKVGQSAMLERDCSLTKQCPSCTELMGRKAIQCCWPVGKGGGSPFDGPGFCLCAPFGLYDYSHCNGGSWSS